MSTNYSMLDIVQELRKLVPSKATRKRVYLDRRNYLICILHYKFKCSEEYIASNLDIKRCSVTHAKRQPIYLVKSADPLFHQNTVHLQKKYPFEVPDNDMSIAKGRERTKTIFLDAATLNRIQLFREKYHVDNTRSALRLLIDLGLNKVEKESITFEVLWDTKKKIKK
jgi:hypothetical protein